MRMISAGCKMLGVMGLLVLAGCSHVKGQVLAEGTKRPVVDAEFTVGHPSGVGVFERHRVDQSGRFDFYISPTDDSHLYLWDGKGDPETAVRRIDRSEISDHMIIYYQSAAGRDY